jgi:transcriptional regulator with XRE-family HTH domain
VSTAPTTTAEQFRTLRIILGLTQVEAAKRIGISQQAVSKIERGLVHLRTEHIASLYELTTLPCSTARRAE